MSARRTLQLAVFWTAVTLLAATAAVAAAIPFTGGTASAAGTTAAAAVCLAGLALEPRRKDHR